MLDSLAQQDFLSEKGESGKHWVVDIAMSH